MFPLTFGSLFVVFLCGIQYIPNADAEKWIITTKPVLLEESGEAGKKSSKPLEYPSVVLMNVYDEPGCTGTIYNREWVLSAAHCVISLDPSDYTFFAGKQDKYKVEKGQQKTSVLHIIRHEGYDTETLANDIALFKVSPPFNFTNNVKAVELASKNWNKEGKVIPVGWSRQAANKKTPGALQQAKLDILANDDCSEKMDNVFDTTICAWSISKMASHCQGNSGGPLFYKEKSGNVQVGIVSTGAACAKKGNAGIYTRISKYLSWIKSRTTAKAGRGAKTAVVFRARAKDSQKDDVVPLTDVQVEDKARSFPRSIGGVEARKHQFPSIVLIEYNGRVICSGTIIHSKWILSAAHCVLGKNPSDFSILAGKHEKYADEDMEQNVTAIQIVKHSAFSNDPYNNDIALFKVSPPLKLNKYVRPAKLPKPGMEPEGMSMSAGWGAAVLGDDSSDNLQRARLPILTNEKCKEKYGENQIFPGSLCAGYKKGKSPCHGDSGGPLYFLAGHTQTVIGVMSWVQDSGKPYRPGVYTRVTEYLAWIDEHTGLRSSRVRG